MIFKGTLLTILAMGFIYELISYVITKKERYFAVLVLNSIVGMVSGCLTVGLLMLIKESWAYQYQPYSSALAVMGELLKYVPISVVEAFKAIKDLFVDGATLNECEALAYVITMIGFPLAIGFAYSAWDISIPVIRSLILVVLSMICAFLCSMLVALVVAVMEFFTSGEDVLRFFGLLAFFVAVFAPPGIVIVAISD